jgi:CYTH domain-containing protein
MTVPTELERRFRLKLLPFMRALQSGAFVETTIKQWYLTPVGTKPTVRVRRTTTADNGSSSWVQTIKGRKDKVTKAKAEVELPIPAHIGEALAQMAVYQVLSKTRWIFQYHDFKFEIDVFEDPRLHPYHVVEVEYSADEWGSVDAWNKAIDAMLDQDAKPVWLGEEVTDRDPSNRDLAAKLGFATEVDYEDEDYEPLSKRPRYKSDNRVKTARQNY